MTPVWTVAGLKGGVGKTTTSVHLAVAAAASGRRVLLVDADPQGSALSWSEAAVGLADGVEVIGLPVRDLHRRLPGLAVGWDLVVIDTPPGDAAISSAALQVATRIVLPLTPATLDVDRLGPTLDLVADVAERRPVLDLPRVLLTRVRPRTVSVRAVRAVLGEMGVPVMAAEVPLRESFAVGFGSRPAVVPEYAAAAVELGRL